MLLCAPPKPSRTPEVENQPTDLQRVARIAPIVQIQSVSLQTLDLQSTLPCSGFEPEGIRYTPEPGEAEYEVVDVDRLAVLVSLDLDVFGDDPDDGDDPVFRVSATFCVQYSLLTMPEHASEDLQSFARINGTFNVWPYWRALVQALGNQAGLHNLVIPVFRPHELPDRHQPS